MSRNYLPATLAEQYQQVEVQKRKRANRLRIYTVLYFTVIITIDILLFWPVSS